MIPTSEKFLLLAVITCAVIFFGSLMFNHGTDNNTKVKQAPDGSFIITKTNWGMMTHGKE